MTLDGVTRGGPPPRVTSLLTVEPIELVTQCFVREYSQWATRWWKSSIMTMMFIPFDTVDESNGLTRRTSHFETTQRGVATCHPRCWTHFV